jgi:F0F1-type ATP synthase membrane subunit c/vacuolar-type H+-ATPase subunit K
MKIDNRIKTIAMLMMGVVLLTLTLFAISMADATTVLRAFGAPVDTGFIPAQLGDGDGIAILGLGVGAGLALGLAGIGAALGMGTASAAALGAITEKPETFGKSILYVVFIEAVAIYGFVIAFLLVGYIGNLVTH